MLVQSTMFLFVRANYKEILIWSDYIYQPTLWIMNEFYTLLKDY